MSGEHEDTDTDDLRRPGHRRDREALRWLNVDQLQELAAQAHIDGRCLMGKDELLEALTGRRA